MNLHKKPAIVYLKEHGHKRLRHSLKNYLRLKDISFAEYSVRHLARDLDNGTAQNWRNIGAVTIENTRQQLQSDGLT